jgi:hypothetical protein
MWIVWHHGQRDRGFCNAALAGVVLTRGSVAIAATVTGAYRENR